MTSYYRVCGPLGSRKTTAAIDYTGHLALAGERFVVAQPSIDLIDQSINQFRERWPNVAIRAIHSETADNVAREIADHTRASSSGEALFITHAALMQSLYWDRRKDWHLIIDEAPQVSSHDELRLTRNHDVIVPAFDVQSYNVRYSVLVPGDLGLLEAIASSRGRKGPDMVDALFADLASKMLSGKWNLYVLSEQCERFESGAISDGRLNVFGLIDPTIFDGFATSTIMSANLERTIAYQHLVRNGHTFRLHNAIENKLLYTEHSNGELLTIHYAVEEGNWSKHKRNKPVKVDDLTCTVNDLIVAGALDLFGDDPFVWLANKDIEENDPFGGCGIKLPHAPHGLNKYQHFHNAAVLAALNPSPAFYAFLDEVAHLNSEEVRRAVYHEASYQAAGRISTRDLADQTPKHVVVADRTAAEALAELYPGAGLMRLPFADLVPGAGKRGPKRIHACNADRKAAYRDRRKADLLAQLDQINMVRCETNLPCTYKANSSRPDGGFGGSVFTDVFSKLALGQAGDIATSDFIGWLRDLHNRIMAKDDAFLWSPAEFDPNKAPDTCRGLANITAIRGVWLDNDGGDLTLDEFAAMFPYLTMVIYNSSSSIPALPKWRPVIPTTCRMTVDVHADIIAQIMKSLNRRGFYDRKQLESRAPKGLDGKAHGFDTSKLTASSLFYLPAQAAAGPDASFFRTFEGEKRQAIDPYRWIDKTIINSKPDPEPEPAPAAATPPVSLVRKDPKLTRFLQTMEADKQERWGENYQRRVEAALHQWRYHSKGTGNDAFFQLAASLIAAGMAHGDVERTLYAELAYAHGPQSRKDRKADIPRIMRALRCVA